jgi:hypothetical protein
MRFACAFQMVERFDCWAGRVHRRGKRLLARNEMFVQRPSKIPQFLDPRVDVLDAACQEITDLSTGRGMLPALSPGEQSLHVVQCQPQRLRLFDETSPAAPHRPSTRGIHPLFVVER